MLNLKLSNSMCKNYLSRNVKVPNILNTFFEVYRRIMSNDLNVEYSMDSYYNMHIYFRVHLAGRNFLEFTLMKDSICMRTPSISKNESISDEEVGEVRICMLKLAQKATDSILNEVLSSTNNIIPTSIDEIEL